MVEKRLHHHSLGNRVECSSERRQGLSDPYRSDRLPGLLQLLPERKQNQVSWQRGAKDADKNTASLEEVAPDGVSVPSGLRSAGLDQTLSRKNVAS
jgi:hypothetical protein